MKYPNLRPSVASLALLLGCAVSGGNPEGGAGSPSFDHRKRQSDGASGDGSTSGSNGSNGAQAAGGVLAPEWRQFLADPSEDSADGLLDRDIDDEELVVVAVAIAHWLDVVSGTPREELLVLPDLVPEVDAVCRKYGAIIDRDDDGLAASAQALRTLDPETIDCSIDACTDVPRFLGVLTETAIAALPADTESFRRIIRALKEGSKLLSIAEARSEYEALLPFAQDFAEDLAKSIGKAGLKSIASVAFAAEALGNGMYALHVDTQLCRTDQSIYCCRGVRKADLSADQHCCEREAQSSLEVPGAFWSAICTKTEECIADTEGAQCVPRNPCEALGVPETLECTALETGALRCVDSSVQECRTASDCTSWHSAQDCGFECTFDGVEASCCGGSGEACCKDGKPCSVGLGCNTSTGTCMPYNCDSADEDAEPDVRCATDAQECRPGAGCFEFDCDSDDVDHAPDQVCDAHEMCVPNVGCTAIDRCEDGDGACPSGCDFDDDNDCAPCVSGDGLCRAGCAHPTDPDCPNTFNCDADGDGGFDTTCRSDETCFAGAGCVSSSYSCDGDGNGIPDIQCSSDQRCVAGVGCLQYNCDSDADGRADTDCDLSTTVCVPMAGCQPFNCNNGSDGLVDDWCDPTAHQCMAGSGRQSYGCELKNCDTDQDGMADIHCGLGWLCLGSRGCLRSNCVDGHAQHIYCDPGRGETCVQGVGCQACGNGTVEPGEDCDGGDLRGQTCDTVAGGTTGALACTSGCRFDTAGCAAPPRLSAVNGLVTDSVTAYQWHADVAGQAATFAAAQQGCTGSSLGGFTDWRLPTADELATLLLGPHGSGGPWSGSGCKMDTATLAGPCDVYWTTSSRSIATNRQTVDFNSDVPWNPGLYGPDTPVSSVAFSRCMRR